MKATARYPKGREKVEDKDIEGEREWDTVRGWKTVKKRDWEKKKERFNSTSTGYIDALA